jgi:hypothetical protein
MVNYYAIRSTAAGTQLIRDSFVSFHDPDTATAAHSSQAPSLPRYSTAAVVAAVATWPPPLMQLGRRY